ncbi:MAG: acetylornithine transaminase [Nocardioidaceae bacterium]
MTTLEQRYGLALMNAFGPPQRVLSHGHGCYVWDVDGNRYLDMLGGIAVNSLGHAHPAIVATLANQAATLAHVSNFFATEPQIELAERLVEILDVHPARVFFTNSGSEANEAALKLTRRTGRHQIVAAIGAFHGRTFGALSLTAKAGYRKPFEPLIHDVAWVPYGDADSLRAAVSSRTAAIVLEPIQGEAGVVVPPDGYLLAARRVADDSGALLWLDEVQTGVGRTGDWFAFQHSTSSDDKPAARLRPDIVTIAKGLGGGFPVGACIGIGPVGELFGPGEHGTTFGGNPLAAATALTVLEVIDKEGLLEHVRTVGARLQRALGALEGVIATRGRGLLVGAELAPGRATEVARAALRRGLIVNSCTPDTLRFAPPLIIEQPQVDDAVSALADCLLAGEAGADMPALTLTESS